MTLTAQYQLHTLSNAPVVPLAARLALWFAVAVTRWHVTRHTRQQLAKLDDHLLRDIGLSPEQAQRESTLPFWR